MLATAHYNFFLMPIRHLELEKEILTNCFFSAHWNVQQVEIPLGPLA